VDSQVSVEELKRMFCAFRDDIGWAHCHTPENLAKAISVEAAELLELFLWQTEASLDSPDNLKACEHELADIFMLCLSLADIMKIDISQSVAEKMAIHAEKYRGSGRKTDCQKSEDD